MATIKHISIKSEIKGALKPLVDTEQSLARQIATVGAMHDRAKRNLWEMIDKLYPETKKKFPTLIHPEEGEWELVYIDDD